MRFDLFYQNLLNIIIKEGFDRDDRTDTGTRSVFGVSYEVDLEHEFPLLTLREINWQVVIHELIWFLTGDESLDYLHQNGIRMWDPWAEDGKIKKGYGYQWRKWGDDQIARLLKGIEENPFSRRHIVSAWNVGELDEMSLPPCHAFFQVYIAENKLSLLLYQRSCDVIIGLPFNTAEYALLTHMLADATGYKVGKFVHYIGDAHIYHNLFDEAHELMARTPSLLPPSLTLNTKITAQKIIRPELSSTDFGLHSYYPQARMALRNKVAI